MVSGQLSFFSADALPPSTADLEGLLAGPGQVARRAGAARVSVVVADDWRVAALRNALQQVGLEPELAPAGDDATVVRTPFTADLLAVAERWTRGAAKHPPAGFALDGRRLRWWCLASGSGGPLGYTLGLGPSDEPAWSAVGAALAAAGVPGVLLGPRADGPAYRIVGQRRLARLAELVGPPPPGAPAAAWPART